MSSILTSSTDTETDQQSKRSVSRGRDALVSLSSSDRCARKNLIGLCPTLHQQKSTGRGGAGNIRASPSVGQPGETDSLSPVRGREIDNRQDKVRSSRSFVLYDNIVSNIHPHSHSQIQSVGRGGVGNIRSRSRSRAAAQIPDGFPQTQSLVSEHQAATAAHERRVIEDAAKANIVVCRDRLFLPFPCSQ